MNTISANGLVGYRVNTIQEVIKAQEAGLIIVDKWGDNFSYPIEDEDGEREATDEEVLNNIVNEMKNGTYCYAAFKLDCGKVVPNANTTLQSEFFIGQYVYTMMDNKIVKGEIQYMTLSASQDAKDLYADRRAERAVSDIFNFLSSYTSNYRLTYVDLGYDNKEKVKAIAKRAINDSCVIIKINKQTIMRNFDEIFASKQDLLNNLAIEIE